MANASGRFKTRLERESKCRPRPLRLQVRHPWWIKSGLGTLGRLKTQRLVFSAWYFQPEWLMSACIHTHCFDMFQFVKISKCALICPSTTGSFFTVGGGGCPTSLTFIPPTSCFATPTFISFSDFLALKWWWLAWAMQNCHSCRHFGSQVIVFIL